MIALAGILALLLGAGAALGALDRRRFAPNWLCVAAVLVALHDLALTRAYGWFAQLIGGAWNWQGKLTALALTLVVAALPGFGWRRVGLTLARADRSHTQAGRAATLGVVVGYCVIFVGLALAFPSEPASAETIAFQLTMPGLEEEPFYRGILLHALDRAFVGRVRIFGVEWGWGAVLSCLLFGLGHALDYTGTAGFTFDAMIMALTAGPSFIAVWLRLRTGSLLLPVLLHNFGNSIALFV